MEAVNGNGTLSSNNNKKMGETVKQKPLSSWGRRLGVTMVVLILDLIGFTVILPLFPSILTYYKNSDKSGWYANFSKYANSLGNRIGAPPQQPETVLMGGLLGSMFCLCQFLSCPILGAFADVYGRKKALILCMIGIAASHGIWIGASTFPLFILSRIVGGLSRANVSICTTVVADDCPKEMRPKGMACIGIAFSIGFVVGPSIGAYFSYTGNSTAPAIVCLCASLLSLLIIIISLEETLEPKYRAKRISWESISSYVWPPSLFRFQRVSVGKKLQPLGFVYFLYIFIYSGLEFTLTFLGQAKFKFTSVEQGKMFTGLGVCMAFLQGTVTRRVTPETEIATGMMGMLLMVPAFFVLGFCTDLGHFALGLFCYSIGSAVCGPMLTSVASSLVPQSNERGVALGTFRSLGALARTFGPLVASSLFWKFGPEVTYCIGALAIILPLLLFRQAQSQPGS